MPPCGAFVTVDRYLPGCPPTPELFMAALFDPPEFTVQHKRLPGMRPQENQGHAPDASARLSSRVRFNPEICLINQGYLCVGSSTRGGCRALCTRPGHPCVAAAGHRTSLSKRIRAPGSQASSASLRDDRYSRRGDRSGAAFAATGAVFLPVRGLCRPRTSPRQKEKVL